MGLSDVAGLNWRVRVDLARVVPPGTELGVAVSVVASLSAGCSSQGRLGENSAEQRCQHDRLHEPIAIVRGPTGLGQLGSSRSGL